MPDQTTCVTVVEKVYHRAFGEDPKLVNTNFVSNCNGHEQLFQRRMLVTKDWKPLELGWFDSQSAGMLVIGNPKIWQTTTPTADAKAELEGLSLLVSYSKSPDEAVVVPPGETARFRCANAAKLSICCPTAVQPHYASINVFPR